MNVRTELSGDYLILTPAGRLDGHGAGLLQQVLSGSMQDTVRSIIIDLSETLYLSSAGIRVFLIARNMLRGRSGSVVLCNVSEFPSNVLTMAGMNTVFPMVPDRKEALAFLDNRSGNSSSSVPTPSSRFSFEDATIDVTPAGSGVSVLNVMGSLTKVLHAGISPEDVKRLKFSDCEYSLGLGALAENAETARNLLGEMITLHGSIVWLPADGNSTPDFFTPVRESGGVEIFSGFAAALQGPFHDNFTFHTEKPEGTTLSQVYRGIFSSSQTTIQSDRSGIVAVALIGRTCGIRSSGLIHSPIPENAVVYGGSLLDPDTMKNWFEVMDEPRYSGETLVAFGIGVDLKSDLSRFDPEELSSLYYIHPANKGSQAMYLHTHGVVFRHTDLPSGNDIGREIRRLVITGEFLDMRHLMDDTRLSNARCAVSYISAIRIRN